MKTLIHEFFRTGRNFTFAANNFKELEKWISMLTICSIEHINITKQSFLEQSSVK